MCYWDVQLLIYICFCLRIDMFLCLCICVVYFYICLRICLCVIYFFVVSMFSFICPPIYLCLFAFQFFRSICQYQLYLLSSFLNSIRFFLLPKFPSNDDFVIFLRSNEDATMLEAQLLRATALLACGDPRAQVPPFCPFFGVCR